MELRDFIVTPIIIFLVYIVAYSVRHRVTDSITSKYYFPALTFKILGALALGFIYQFYYHGGDTFAYHTHGSRHVWEAFMESPSMGLKLLFSEGEFGPGLWSISDKIWYYRDQKSFFIIRIASVLDLLTFSSYSATAVLFSVISFIGGWMLFVTFYKKYTIAHRWIAGSCLFVPSVIFWGSGILKDTITLAALGIATFCVDQIFLKKRYNLGYAALLLFTMFVIYSIKIYILMSFLLAGLLWIFSSSFFKIKSSMLRVLVIPFVIGACGLLSYVAINKMVEDDPHYSFDTIAETVRTTAYDIRYWTGKDAGSGYSLGELDGSMGSVITLAPSAINVSLFRPYIWEVNNPLMLLSALESLLTLCITIFILFKIRSKFWRYMQSPEIVFCLVFALIFAFGVGVSTYNFGTLARYKIPLLPFYLTGIGLMYHYWKSERKFEEFESTE